MMGHYSLSSFDSIGERMVAEDQAEGVVLDPVQLITNEWVPRVAGAITTISSICMLCMAWKRRAWLFHRLVLGKKTKRNNHTKEHKLASEDCGIYLLACLHFVRVRRDVV